MSEKGYRLATDEENEAARQQLREQSDLAAEEVKRAGVKRHPRLADSDTATPSCQRNPSTREPEIADRILARMVRRKIEELNQFLSDMPECDITVTFSVERVESIVGDYMMIDNVGIERFGVKL